MYRTHRIMSFLSIYCVLQTLIYHSTQGFYISELTDRGLETDELSASDVSTNYENDMSDNTAKTLIEVLKLLENYQTTKQKGHNSILTEGVRDLRNYGQDDPSAEKRNYGILPPWRELCRMMKITHCSVSRS